MYPKLLQDIEIDQDAFEMTLQEMSINREKKTISENIYPNGNQNFVIWSRNLIQSIFEIMYLVNQRDLSKYKLFIVDLPLLFNHNLEYYFRGEDDGIDYKKNIENTNKSYSKYSALFSSSQKNYFSELKIIISVAQAILSDSGFFAIKISNHNHHKIKTIIDSIFGIENFINEINIDAPFKRKIKSIDNVIGSVTGTILVYSKKKGMAINAMYKEKSRKPYWHTMHSKGQGKPKIFSVNGEEIEIAPPVGSHWKYKQEKIDKMCKDGRIKLNRNNNPVYLVSGTPYILDNNWLDVQSWIIHNKKIITNTRIIERLIGTFTDKKESVLHLISNNSDIVNQIREMERSLTVIDVNEEHIKNIREKTKHHETRYYQSAFYDFHSIKLPNKELEKLDKSTNLDHEYDPQKRYILKNYDLHQIEGYNISEVDRAKVKSEISFVKNVNEQIPLGIHNLIEYYKSDANKKRSLNNFLIQGDNLKIIKGLSEILSDQIKLIYIDPPYFAGKDEIMDIPIGKSSNLRIKDTLLPKQELAYENNLVELDAQGWFSNWFRARVEPMYNLLSNHGFLAVRFDYHFGHYAKVILDEIFGEYNFIGDFLVRRMTKTVPDKYLKSQKHLINQNDNLYIYRKTDHAKFNSIAPKKKRSNQDTIELENNNVWLDIVGYEKNKKTLYPTENSQKLLKRVLKLCSNEQDMIADFFSGSGTTLSVAQDLGRSWIGVDLSKHAINEIRKRILGKKKQVPFYVINLNKSKKKQEKSIINNIDFQIKQNGKQIEIYLGNIISDDKRYNEILQDKDLENEDFIDFWTVDWDYKSGKHYYSSFESWRHLGSGRKISKRVEIKALHRYEKAGNYLILVKIYDIFGNEILKRLNCVVD